MPVAKVKEIKNLNRQNDFGTWSHVVTMENGDEGFVNTKDQTGAQWQPGMEILHPWG